MALVYDQTSENAILPGRFLVNSNLGRIGREASMKVDRQCTWGIISVPDRPGTQLVMSKVNERPRSSIGRASDS